MRPNQSDMSMSPIQKLRLALGAAVLVIGGGTLGFILVEDMSLLDSLYMTVITLSTVGFREVAPMHDGGKVFIIFLILFGVALMGFTVAVIGELVLEGQFAEIIGRRKMESKLRKISDHHIIAGFGRVGRQVAEEFKKRNIPFVVVEKDNAAIYDLFNGSILYVQGQATDDDILRKAGIESASTLVSTLPHEAENVYLALTARSMNSGLHIIARADYEEGVKKLKRAGADHVVSPHVLGGIRMAMASLRPNVVDFMQMTSLGEGGLSIEELVIPSGSRLSGQTLKDSTLKSDFGATIIGIKQAGRSMEITPGPDTVMNETDILVLIGKTDELERLSKTLN